MSLLRLLFPLLNTLSCFNQLSGTHPSKFWSMFIQLKILFKMWKAELNTVLKIQLDKHRMEQNYYFLQSGLNLLLCRPSKSVLIFSIAQRLDSPRDLCQYPEPCAEWPVLCATPSPLPAYGDIHQIPCLHNCKLEVTWSPGVLQIQGIFAPSLLTGFWWWGLGYNSNMQSPSTCYAEDSYPDFLRREDKWLFSIKERIPLVSWNCRYL